MSENTARRFHDLYEKLAPQFGYETRKDTKDFDPESNNGKLMIAVTDVFDKELREWKHERDVLVAALQKYTAAFPTCEEHKPNGGTRTTCLECYIIKLTHTLSQISYLCSEPNELQVSEYDTHCDEDLVVNSVKERLEGAKNLHNALTTSTELLRDMAKTNDLTWKSLMEAQIAANEAVLKDGG